jgi:hypothetical protein
MAPHTVEEISVGRLALEVDEMDIPVPVSFRHRLNSTSGNAHDGDDRRGEGSRRREEQNRKNGRFHGRFIATF